MKPDGKYTPPSPINPVSILRAIILLIVLYLLTFYSPSLFHALAELFRIAIMLTIFVVFWNARRFLDNGYLFFISIAFLFISGLDLLHALASEGMTIFPGQDADLHSYLWIAARYVESISLLIAPFWVRRKPRTTYLFTGYTVLTVLLLNSIFVWNFYPASYLEKTMWGSFIGVNELLITFILLAAAFRLYQVRTTFALDVYQLMLTSILLAAAAELLFAFYPNNHSAPTHIAHLLRIASVYHVYRAVVETGIKKPHALLFRNLQQNETALRLSERRYKALFEQTNDAVFIISLDLVHQAVNEQAARMLGYSVQEIVGQKVERFIAPEELPDSQRRAEMLFSGEKLPVYERRFLHKDGSTRYGEISLALIKDEHGKPSHIQSIVHDVTERKRAEQVLQESENRSRSIIEQSYDGIVLVNERGEIIEWNRGEERITGLTRSEAIGQKAWDIQFRLTPFERRNRTFYEHGKKLLQDYFKTGTPPWLNQARDMKIRHTNGTIRYIQQLSFPIPTSKGYMLGGIVRNITEQKQAEEILRESEARYKALYSMVRLMCDNVPDLIWAKDMEKKYLFANRAICEKLLIARDTDEPIGKTDLYFAERERQAHPENPEWHTFGESVPIRIQ